MSSRNDSSLRPLPRSGETPETLVARTPGGQEALEAKSVQARLRLVTYSGDAASVELHERPERGYERIMPGISSRIRLLTRPGRPLGTDERGLSTVEYVVMLVFVVMGCVNFGETIGDFVKDGVARPTSNGIITYAGDGSIHIIPAAR